MALYQEIFVREAFAKVRHEKRLTIAEMGEKLGVSRVSIGKILNEGGNPRLDLLVKFLNVFKDIDPIWVLSGQGSMYVSETEEDKSNLKEKMAFMERELQDKRDLILLLKDALDAAKGAVKNTTK